jgi:predicted flap endonuclease-1-like 5' DNA nuclease
MAEQSRLRAERAERLARLVPARTGRSEAAAAPADLEPAPADDPDAAAALEEFLRSLTQGLSGQPPRAAAEAAAPAAGLRFERPPSPEGDGRAKAAPCDLERLEGVGPGLVWALRRAGIRDLAGMAALEPAGLAARLGPIGRLVPAEAWIASARAETGA